MNIEDVVKQFPADAMPEESEFIAAGGDAEQYQAFAQKRKDELAAKAEDSAKGKAARMKKYRVKAGQGMWRQGQSHYVVPALHPHPPNTPAGNMPKREPGIRLPIGKVSAVPIRDDYHEKLLDEDPNLEPVADTAFTWEEQREIEQKAVADALAKAADKKAPAASVQGSKPKK